MVYLAPPEKLAQAPQLPGWEETALQKQERYEQIANALYEVAYDPNTKPLFVGGTGRASTAATVLAIAFFESGFAHDVDVGPCYRGKPGTPFFKRCDGGLAVGLMQVRVDGDTTSQLMHGVEGLTRAEVFSDRKSMFRIGLHMVRKSFAACRKYGEDWSLNVYASGSCKYPDGRPSGLSVGRARLRLARKLLAEHPAPGPDSKYMVDSNEKNGGEVSLLEPR